MEILTQFRGRRSVNSPPLFGANVEGLSACIAIIPTSFLVLPSFRHRSTLFRLNLQARLVETCFALHSS